MGFQVNSSNPYAVTVGSVTFAPYEPPTTTNTGVWSVPSQWTVPTHHIVLGTTPTASTNTTKKESNMRSLYRVHAVHAESEEVESVEVVAKDERAAERKALSKLELPGDLDDYDFIVEVIGSRGSIRPRREVQEVKVVEG